MCRKFRRSLLNAFALRKNVSWRYVSEGFSESDSENWNSWSLFEEEEVRE
jgi:hypothetical protein